MRIAFDAKRYYHNRTGLGNYSRTLISGICNSDPGLEPLLYDAGTFERTFHLGKKAKTDGAMLYHGLSNELPFDLVRSGIPGIVTIHDVCWRTFPDMYHAIDRKLYDIKYGWAARNADFVIAISDSTRRDVMEFFNVPEERIATIYQPVGKIYYSQISKSDANKILSDAGIVIPTDYMLYVGSVNSRKNLLGVIRAMARLPQSCRMPLVVIGGGGEYRKTVISEIGHLGLENLVMWLSCNDDSVLQALYTLANLFVYPSFYEGLGLPVVEASLSACPVLTSNVSSLPEAGGPWSLQADPSSVDDIACKMEQGIADSSLRQKMISGGREYALEHFAPEKLFKQLLNLYSQKALY